LYVINVIIFDIYIQSPRKILILGAVS
jgi:hypothetical protein